jgi:type VI secretion system protein VasD
VRRRNALSLLLSGALAPALGGCAVAEFLGVASKKPAKDEKDAEKPPENARLELVATASPLINPDLDGRPSPMVLRVYLLTSQEKFKQADFGQLFEAPEKALDATLLKTQDVILTPGGVKEATIKLPPDTLAVGLVGAFRQYEKAKWRASALVGGNRKTKLKIVATTLAVEIDED